MSRALDRLPSIHPVVLTGGSSRRFGSDKLTEPFGDGMLVETPIAALRAVFGARVRVVGDCSPRVVAAADGEVPDPYPGVGPLGGVLAALEHFNEAVFVLAGDLPTVGPRAIRAVLESADANPAAAATIAATDRPHPCIGLYRATAAEHLRRALGSGRRALHKAIPTALVELVEVPAEVTRNVNHREDLGG